MASTIRDVAKLAGASVAAVSATLNGGRSSTIRVGEETKTRIFNAAAQLGYVTNPIAKSLATGRTGVIGLMLPYADAFAGHDPFSLAVMRGVMQGAVVSHKNVMLYSAVGGLNESSIAMMIDSRVDGLVLVMPEEEGAVITKLERRGIPYVSVLRKPKEGIWTVNSDDREGGRLAASHLMSLGHKDLLALRGNPTVVTSEPRAEGFSSCVKEHGHSCEVLQSGFDWKEGYSSVMEVFRRPSRRKPTAIFAANDFCAQGVIMALAELGVQVPDDIALVGYDDTPQAESIQPRLTSIHMGVVEMGELALEMLAARLGGASIAETQPLLPVRLTIRDSCGARLQGRIPEDGVDAALNPTKR